MSDKLSELRAQVADLDLQILSLVSRRLETSKAIGEAKRAANLPIRDFRVEVQVLARARQCALTLGFDPEVAEKILSTLVAAAVQTQVEQPLRLPQEGQKRILVVGGAGRMGDWLCRFFAGQGHVVGCCDSHAQCGEGFTSLADAFREPWDALVLATPLGSLPGVWKQALQCPGNPLIFDIGSLKSHLSESLRAAAAEGRRVASLHPMFAPGAILLDGRTILVCDAGCAEATRAAKALFEGTAVSLYEVALEEHDKIMAVLLGLSHSVNLIFGAALREYGLPFKQLGSVASTTFAKQATTAAEVAGENPHLYHEIQALNVHTNEVYQGLEAALSKFRDAASRPDSQDFTDLMAANKEYFFGN